MIEFSVLRHDMTRLRWVTGIMITVMLVAGCATPSSREPSASPAGLHDRTAISVGMSAAQLRQAWGEPKDVKYQQDPQLAVEVWSYEGAIKATAVPVATSTREVMAYNPVFEGGVVPTIEPVYTIRTERTMTLHHVVLIDGKVARFWRTQHELPPVVN